MSSNDKVAIVTGAGSGIGKAVAVTLLKHRYSGSQSPPPIRRS